jgi:hypothetical protein
MANYPREHAGQPLVTGGAGGAGTPFTVIEFKSSYETDKGETSMAVYNRFGDEVFGLTLPFDSESDKIRRQADETIAKANAEIQRAEARLAQLDQFGDDIYEDETPFIFYKKFSNSGIKYTYMGGKIAGKWYITGPQFNGQPFSWGNLIKFIIDGNKLDEIEFWIGEGWARLV